MKTYEEMSPKEYAEYLIKYQCNGNRQEAITYCENRIMKKQQHLSYDDDLGFAIIAELRETIKEINKL